MTDFSNTDSDPQIQSSSLNRSKAVLDLFCGAGGLSYGFEDAGFSVVAGIDQSSQAVETWTQNHRGTGATLDLAETSPEEALTAVNCQPEDIDIIVGGPPCKDFSTANRVVDLGRNNLVVLFAEYVESIQPEAFLIENVKQLTTTDSDVLEEVYDKLDDSYTISHKVLDAADYGVPQHRLRAFVIGIRDDLAQSAPKFPQPTHGPDSKDERSLQTAGSAISDLSDESFTDKEQKLYSPSTKHAHLLEDIPPGMNYSFYTDKVGHPEPEFEWRSKFSDYLYKADPEKPVRTLKAEPGAASGPYHWNNRRFTEKELARLQGFPDSFTFDHGYTEVVRQIGNSVPPVQAYALAVAIRTQLPSEVELIDADTDLGFYSRRRTSTEEYRKKAATRINELYGEGTVTIDDEN